MTEPTATDRAMSLMRKATADPGKYTIRRDEDDDLEPLYVMQARAALRALKSDPDVLADLAIEAGALEQVGSVRWHEAVVGSAWPVIAGTDDSMEGSLTAGTSVYRRTPTEETTDV